MATYEELLEIIKTQQTIIEKLTAELEAANARIAELEEKLHKNSHNSSKPPQTAMKNRCQKVSAKRAEKKQEGRPDIKDIILNSVNQTV